MAASLKNEIRKINENPSEDEMEHKQYCKYLFILYFMH